MLLPQEIMKFKHSVRTSVKDKRLSYTDAIVLAFASLGNPAKGVPAVEVMKLVDTWKVVPHATFVQYITSTYCGESAQSTTTLKVKKDPNSAKVATLWYRAAPGKYALTELGKQRVGALMDAFRVLPSNTKAERKTERKMVAATKKVKRQPAPTKKKQSPRVTAPMGIVKVKTEIPLEPPHATVIPQPPPTRMGEIINALLTLRPIPAGISASELIDLLGEFTRLQRRYNLDKKSAQRLIDLIF